MKLDHKCTDCSHQGLQFVWSLSPPRDLHSLLGSHCGSNVLDGKFVMPQRVSLYAFIDFFFRIENFFLFHAAIRNLFLSIINVNLFQLKPLQYI